MTTKTDYLSEEWIKLLTAPYYASMLIVASDPNFGFIKELAALAQSLALSATESKSELIRAVATDLNSKETQESLKPELDKMQEQKDPEILKGDMLEQLKSVVDIIRQKSNTEASTFSQWLLYLADQTAQGSKEGGFLGIGAVRVSDREKAMLAEIRQALSLEME